MLNLIKDLLDNKTFQNTIVGVILANAAILGFMTIEDLNPSVVALLEFLDNACLIVFCIEIVMKLLVYRLRFFFDSWNIFDFIVVGIALAPASGPLAVLRALRVFRLMRMVSTVPSMRIVVSGMFAAIPGISSVAGVLIVIFYVAAIMASSFFQEVDPAKFGNLATTFFTLFQLMTLEGWPDVARPVMEKLPHAWLFFIPFIIMTTFTTLNLLFGIIVNAMEETKEEEARMELEQQGIASPTESNEMRMAIIEHDVRLIREKIAALTSSLTQ
ncbi:MAG: ion transporter [Methylobacter sp.]